MNVEMRQTLDSLSDDFWMDIFSHLDAKSLCQIARTCYSFYILAEDKMLWIYLLKRDRKNVILVPSDVPHNPKDFYVKRKDFDTISEAIKAASAAGKDRIFVAPGLYKETLTIDKPVEIYGEGPVGAAIVEGSTANTVLSTASEGLLANLSLKQTGHWFCVDVEKGAIVIKGCDITNSTLSAVKIGREGVPIISGNKIHDSHEAGVAVFGGGGTIEHNEFYRNRYGSIEVVYATAQPIIRHNSIHNNRGYGIHIHTQSRPVVLCNVVSDNDSDGISCWGAADPYVSQNKVCRNKGDGIYIHEDGKGTFEKNEIFNQKLDGIRTSKSSPTIIDNIIHHNDGDGVRIVLNANPTVKGNQIFDNNRVGIHVYREGCGSCVSNHIYGNKNAGMQVYGGGNTAVTNNTIKHNRCTGIYISDRASVYLQSNEISYNGDCGVEIVSGASVPTFEDNDVHHNKSAGVAVYQDTRPSTLEQKNHIHSNGGEFYVPYVGGACSPDIAEDPMCIDTDRKVVGDNDKATENGSKMGVVDIVVREGRAYNNRGKEAGGEVVSFLAERAIHAKMCTFTFTREYYHAQYWYECRTCSAPRQILGRPEISVCEQCAKHCHAGHDLSPRKFGHFYCDCGQISTPSCRCSPDK